MAKPDKCISVEEARELQSNWTNSRGASISRSIGSEDTCEFVYSVEELQEFLDYVKEGSEKEGIANPGVRIYFGAYSGNYSNRATIFLAPTKGEDSDSENNYNLDPMNRNTGGWPPQEY